MIDEIKCNLEQSLTLSNDSKIIVVTRKWVLMVSSQKEWQTFPRVFSKWFQNLTLRYFVCKIERWGSGEGRNIRKEERKGRRGEVVGWRLETARRYF